MNQHRTLFITGYPGFLARWLLRKCLQTDDRAVFYLLVHPNEQQRADQALKHLEDTSTHKDLRERISIVYGDIRSIDLGLSGQEVREVSGQVGEVYHLAAVHSLSEERRMAEAVNVHGTANVLAFARAMPNLRRFVHFSSAYVSGRRTGVIMEDELEPVHSFRNPYEATKYQSEVLVRRAADRLPVTIIRPSGVVGDSRTGEIDRFDSVYHMGMLLVASPVTPPLTGEGGAPLNLVPVDYVVDAVHAIVSNDDSIGKTFHVVDPNPLPVRRVYEAIARRAGKKLPRYSVPVNITKVLLRFPGLEKLAAVNHEAVDYLDNMAFYNARNTLAALEGTGVRCPEFEEYVDVLMQYVRDYFDQSGHWTDRGTSDIWGRLP
ncbi:MAG: SDR family oxidoreductase [Myxococcales bacterium]|nr:SDR family oxidoreductase [Myxococcales bacterium]